MSLSKMTKIDLLKQLYQLSNDQQIIEHLNQKIQSRIENVFNKHQKIWFQAGDQHEFGSIKNIKYTGQIQQLNDFYDIRCTNLFEQGNKAILNQIDINQNKKSNRKMRILTESHKNKQIKNETVPSLTSTYSKASLRMLTETNKENVIDKKKSKDNVIGYKIYNQKVMSQKEKRKLLALVNKTEQNFFKNKQKSHFNVIDSKNDSRNALQNKPVNQIKRSKSQSSKFATSSTNLAVKNQKIVSTTYKKSHQNNLLLQSHKFRSLGKNSLQSTTKRQLKSISSFQVLSGFKNNTGKSNKNKSKCKSKEKPNQLKKTVLNFDNIEFQKDNGDFMSKSEKNEFFDEIQIIEDDNDFIQSDNPKRALTQIAPEAHYQSLQGAKDYQGKDSQSMDYLKFVVCRINNEKNQKIEQRCQLEQRIVDLKNNILIQNKRLNEIMSKNQKIQRQVQTITRSFTSSLCQHKVVSRLLKQAEMKLKRQGQKLRGNKSILKKLVQSQINQQAQLIQIYSNVIGQLRKQIKEQLRIRNQAKDDLQILLKRLDSKQVRFQKKFQYNQKIKNDIGKVFKQWTNNKTKS